MLRRLGVRGKILATLAVPIFVLMLAAAYISWGALQDAVSADQTSELVDSLEAQDAAGTAVATERALAIAALNGADGAMEQLVAAQEQTDEAVDARDEELRALETDALSVNVQDAIDVTLEDRRALDELQRKVIAGQITETAATGQYTDIIQRALDLPRAVSASSTDSGLAELLNAYVAMDEVMLANTIERPIVGLALADAARAAQQGEDRDGELVGRMVNAIETTDELQVAAQAQADRLGLDITVPPLSDELDELRFKLRYVNFSSIDPETANSWSELSAGWIDSMRPVRDEVRTETVSYAAQASADARNQAIGTVAATFGIVLISLVLALVIARRIVTPLRRLTVATADVRDRLPQMVEQMAVPGQAPEMDVVQIPVESTDEIGRLANAFNEVNATTIEVAREQAALRGSIAEMFVNVARRDQVLLNRQLAFLDELERSEEDPGTLSNLFRLDHLATRMRRNAESLLVLAGIDSGRRVRTPMPISDVIRTASSEIELYDRVRLNLQADPHMLGHNALNAAHLLAELLENATMFSEPHTAVEVTASRDTRGVVVSVVDQGLGMSATEIADANAKVASSAASDAVGAQRLGLFVVGRLAQRLRVHVDFSSGRDGKGTVATVTFPDELFVADEAMPLPQPTDPLEASTQASVAQLTSPSTDTPLPQGEPSTVPVPGEDHAPASAPAPAEPAPAPAPAPAEPAPAAPAPATSSMQSVAPEAPEVEPVDIAALTDGTTRAGMPRRRRSETTATPTEAIVLPPLETPHLEESDPGDSAWAPPTAVEPAAASLPSRRPSPTGPPEPEAQSGAIALPDAEPTTEPVAPQQRTGLFSSFRTMDNLAESTLQLDAVTDDPADVPELETSTSESAPAPRVEEEAPSERPESDQVVPPSPVPAPAPASAPVPAPAPVPERPAASEPTSASSAPAPERTAATPAPAPAWQPPAEPAPAVPAAPVADHRPAPATQPEVASADSAPVASSTSFAALPAFEELMSDLPTRRTEGGSSTAHRKRGLFGRKPAPKDAPESAVGSVARGGSAQPVGSAGGVDPLSAPSADSSATPSTVPAPRDGGPARAEDASQDAAPQGGSAPVPAPRPDELPLPSAQRRPADRPFDEAWGAARPAGSAPSAYSPPVADEVPFRPEPAASSASASAEPAPAAGETQTDPTVNGERPSRTSYGDSVLPLRSTETADVDAFDPQDVSDTVEARSEWMASAVLYEEMSTLMQRGVFQEENVTTTNEEQTYRPASVAPAANGLTRRDRRDETVEPPERFTARIERDPEQLRARLSAFQTATARGRSETTDEGASTNGPLSVNDVQGSAPHQR
ncbi:nitrate- and nitrite sensing domain-containing protein [Isoptericola sp. AK164]|uniref:sensor histidine kinase n=1 Tax=Isoptericola sp. AK164 TaxID=3024246 RepID=UPI0024184783|nr:nitrate- and nitrite sensing domain-containing protein [Isoptericola sp. AK164]